MKVTPHAAILSINRENGALHPVLLWDEEELILVDAGLPSQLELICRAIQDEGFEPERLTRLIFTHGDVDHIGGARQLLALAPQAGTLAHEDEAGAIDGSLPPPKVGHRRALNLGNPEKLAELDQFAAQYAQDYSVKIDHRFTDGERLPFCGGIRIIHSPGHTDGHVFLYLEADGLLITGDGLNSAAGRLTGPNPVHTIDMEQAGRSIARLAAMGLDIRQVATYHGGLVAGDIQNQLERLA